MDALQKRMPFSLDAEQSVLGSVLIDPNCLNEIAEILVGDDFYIEEHKKIFEIMLAFNLDNRTVDLVTLINELVARGVYSDDAEARSYIRVIAEVVPSAQNAKDYAKIVKDKSILRRLIEAADDIQRAAFTESEDVRYIVDLAERKIFDIAGNNERHDFMHISDILMNTFDHLKLLKDGPSEETIGIQTGFSELDKQVVGLGKGNLIIVGARPGVGKTSFALNIASSVAKRSKKSVCIFSLEMSNEELVQRILSSEAMIDSHNLQTGELSSEDWEKLAMSASILSETGIYVDDTTGISLTSMKAKLRRVKNLGLVIVDYLQLMQPENHRGEQSRVNQIGEISRGLKVLAKELRVPVICLSQLSRTSEKEKERKPMLSDLRDSGSIEQDADMVIFLSRDYYGTDPEKKNLVDVIVAKNRHGSVGSVTMSWLGQYTKFSTLDRETAQRFGLNLEEN
ncbi:MAG: replicative DNA helicase [Clostridia bacterium]|nr:replicative DNA helicase [Clostridia bacterium]